MNTATAAAAPDQAQIHAAMFAQLVMQHTNMALIFLGHSPNPQTGKTVQELDHARFFIDQLEMLEVKTKGNLSKPEEGMLAQSLTNLRLAYVEAVNQPKPNPPTPAPDAPPVEAPEGPDTDEEETPVVEPKLPGEPGAPEPDPQPETSSRKMFSKKYS